MMIKKNFLHLMIFIFLVQSTNAMNLLFRPYDTLTTPIAYDNTCNQWALWAEAGVRPALGFDSEANLVNVLSIWNENQDTLAMLEGFPMESPMAQLRQSLDAQAQGNRGRLAFNADLHLNFGGVIGGRWYFLPHAWFTYFLPIYKTRLTNVSWTDLTGTHTAADLRVRNLLTSQIATIANTFGNGLALTDWQRTGIGDLNIMVEWLFNFPQERPLLKNVAVAGRCGFTLPTGLKADPDLLFAFPYGYDGAVGLLFGGGLTVDLTHCVRAGMDVQLLHLFGNTRIRRIKTSLDQTDLLLLAKAEAYKDFGLTQRFNLFMQLYQIFGGGFSLVAGYQFLKHGVDTLQLDTCEFSNNLANSAIFLDEWVVHSMELNFQYDFSVHLDECAWGFPQASLFIRKPFSGKRAAAFTTVGMMFSIDF